MATPSFQWIQMAVPKVARPEPVVTPEAAARARKLHKKALAKRALRAANAERAAARAQGIDVPPAKIGRPCTSNPKVSTLRNRKSLARKAAAAAQINTQLPFYGQVATHSELCINAALDRPTQAIEQAAAEMTAAAATGYETAESMATEALNAAAPTVLAAAEIEALEAMEPEALEAAAVELEAAEFEYRVEEVAAPTAAECVGVAVGQALEALVAKLEKDDAKRRQLDRRLARELAPDRGYVDHTRKRSRPRDEHACFICLELATDACMPCCMNGVHQACIARWHAMGQNVNKHMVSAPKQGGGWKPKRMERVHKCPVCRTHMPSARVPSK